MTPRSFTILALILCFTTTSWQTALAFDASSTSANVDTRKEQQRLLLQTQPIESIKVELPADDARYGIHGDVLEKPTEYLI